jgi:hypothetical protein
MALPEILIGSKFDAKGFKQAETATDKLTKSIKNLAYSFGLVFSAQKLIAFGKASVKAFAEDENAARSLGMTLKNLNLDYLGASESVNTYISNLEKQTGVLDDELRPAMDRLLRATGSLTESQKLLGLALDISAGTGKSLTTVSQGLQKAYLGNNASLGRLGVGLTKAELSTSSFLQIQERLTELFAGQAVSAANSYLGSMNKLTIASNNAKEIIGKDLLDAMKLISGEEGIGGATTAMEGFATQIGNVIYGIGVLTAKLNSLPILKDVFGAFADVSKYNIIGLLGQLGSSTRARNAGTPAQSPGQRMAIDKAARDALKLQKTNNTLKTIDNNATARKITLTGDQLALQELEKKFDVERIGLFAALNQATDSETQMRLKSLIAIHDQNAALAGQIMKTNSAADAMENFGKAMFGALDVMLNFGKFALGERDTLRAMGIGVTPTSQGFQSFTPPTGGYEGFGSGMTNLGQNNYGGLAGAGQAGGGGAPVVNINVAGSVTTDRDLVSMVTNAIYNNQASGIPINYSTSYA